MLECTISPSTKPIHLSDHFYLDEAVWVSLLQDVERRQRHPGAFDVEPGEGRTSICQPLHPQAADAGAACQVDLPMIMWMQSEARGHRPCSRGGGEAKGIHGNVPAVSLQGGSSCGAQREIERDRTPSFPPFFNTSYKHMEDTERCPRGRRLPFRISAPYSGGFNEASA